MGKKDIEPFDRHALLGNPKLVHDVFNHDLNYLPSNTDPSFKKIQNGFRCREEYIEHFGFALFNQEFLSEMDDVFKKKDINNFFEVGAGHGSLTKLLLDIGLEGNAITYEIIDKTKGWGLSKSPIYNTLLVKGSLCLGNMKSVSNENYDMITISWVPDSNEQDYITFFKNNPNHDWILSINEEGGCTGGPDFWEYINSNYTQEHLFDSYKSFDGLWDKAILYKKI